MQVPRLVALTAEFAEGRMHYELDDGVRADTAVMFSSLMDMEGPVRGRHK